MGVGGEAWPASVEELDGVSWKRWQTPMPAPLLGQEEQDKGEREGNRGSEEVDSG